MSTTRGNDVYVALKEQVDLHTPAQDTNLVTGDYLAFESEAMTGSREVVTSDSIRRAPMKKRAFTDNGTQAAGGELNFTGSQLILEKLLPLATHTASTTQWFVKQGGTETLAGAQDGSTPGSYPKVTMTPQTLSQATDAAAGVVRHRYSLADGGRLQPFTTFVGLTGGRANEGNYTRVFSGCKIGSLSLSAAVNKFLQIGTRIEGVGKKIQDGTRTPTYPLDEVEFSYLFTGASAKIKAGNMATFGELGVSTLELEVNHNLATDDYVLGRVERQSLDEGETDVTGSFEMVAGADSLSGSALNASSSLYNDRAFLERLNAEAKYASLQSMFTDWTRPILEAETVAGSTVSVVKLSAATVSVQEGDEIKVGDTKVRVLSVDLAAKTVTLVKPLSEAPAAGVQVWIPSHLRVTLPFVRLEEPRFNVSDQNQIKGSTSYTAYDTIVIDHVCKL